MSAGSHHFPDGLDRALLAYGQGLAAGARELLDSPYDELLTALRQSGQILGALSRLARDAAWVTQRHGYLVDAAERVLASLRRLEVCLAAPLECDLSVRAREMRDAVLYFRDIVAEVIPAAAYRDPAADLLATVNRSRPAPVLYLQVLPLVDNLLNALRRAGSLADELSRRADQALAVPIPGFDYAEAILIHPLGSAIEIDLILGELHKRATELVDVDPEEPRAYETAVRECFALTPAELALLLGRLLPVPVRWPPG